MTIEEWAEQEQACLWSDLDHAIEYAADRMWSIAAWGVLCRIVKAVKIMGPTMPDEIQWPLVGGGIYDLVLELAGREWPGLSREADLAEYERTMIDYGGQFYALAEVQARMAGTVAKIRSPREWASILEEVR